ncbi:MAG: hypothetical protein IKS64_03705 [Muribaculaceae bacterium]|nr:hypothetical protein [Muribaculaceae bacterium]
MPLQQVGQYLDSHVEHEVIDCVNWSEDFPYKPYSTFVIAVSATRLYVFFSVICKDLRAVNTQDLSPVADDSCVEFFMQVPGCDEYWNFEFNCIGTLNASHRVERPNPTRLTPQELASIVRYASCGIEPIEEQEGTYCWDLTVSIPLTLVGLDGDNLPDYILGNFYKCAGKTANRHYVSWNPIDAPKPDFHRPDCFGKFWFKEQKQTVVIEEENVQTKPIVKPCGVKRLFLKLLKFFSDN